MKVYNNVRGTMSSVPNIEVNRDTVYIRSNIKEINEENFKGWQYDEIQYNKNDYIGRLANNEDSSMLALMVSMLMSEVDMLKSKINKMEVK